MIEFRALGSADLEGPEGTEPCSVLSRPKLLGFLSFLATERGYQRRDTLIGLFWAELDQERARSAVRQSLYHLRRLLGESTIITRGDEEVRMSPDALWCDVAAFAEALDNGDWKSALAFYRGDFLEGLYVPDAPEFERWLDARRKELRQCAARAAWKLAAQEATQRHTMAAGDWSRRAIELSPSDERLLRRVIRLLDGLGDRAGAVREYEAFAQRLSHELELEPSPETKALIDQVRNRAEVAGEPRPRHSPIAPVSEVSQLAETLTSSTPQRVAWWSSPSRWRVVVLAATTMLLLTIGAILIDGYSSANLNRNRVVVVPLENRTGDSALALLGSLAADWITQGLHEIDVIDVVPTATSVGPGPDIAGIVESTGVSYARAAGDATSAGTVVAGAYYVRNDSLEFQAQVIDVGNERLLRAVAPVTGPLGASGAVLASLRHRVVATVAAVLDHRLMVSTAVSPPPSLEAYRLYLEGNRTFYDYPQRMREAIEYFYRAVELDATFTDPRFYVVLAHINLRQWHQADSNAQLLVPLRSRFSPYQRATLDYLLATLRGDRVAALEAARARGVRSDAAVEAFRSNHPREAIAGLADVGDLAPAESFYHKRITLMEAYHVVGDHRRELAESRKARRRYPDRQRVRLSEVRALAALGRLDEVDRALDESLLLPQEGTISAVTVMIQVAGELRSHGYRDASLHAADRAVRWFENRPPSERRTVRFKTGLLQALYLAERWEQARTLAQELARANPADVNAQGFVGVLAARRGDRDDALRMSERLEGMADPYDFGRDVYWQACVASLLGEREHAMVLLREAYARGRVFSILLHTDMDLEPLRDYPPFQEFLRPKG